jgi:hypothetical protein
MNCGEYQENANLFIDSELDIEQQVELLKHLTQCNECQAFVDTTLRINEIQRRERFEFPSEIDDAVMSKLVTAKASIQRPGQFIQGKNYFWKQRISLSIPVFTSILLIMLILGLYTLKLLNKNDQQLTIPALQQYTAQPPTVIMVYGLPPIEVVGKPIVQSTKNIQQFQN